MARIKLSYKPTFAGQATPGTICRFENQDWVCKRATSLPPPDPDFWQPVAIQDPAWDELGPPGPPGRDGVDGKNGRDGLSGRDGEPGQSIEWLGDWRRDRAYERGQAVSHDGSSFVCVSESTRREPSETSRHWDVLASKGEDGRDGEHGIGQRGRRGADGQTVVIENGTPPFAAIFDSDTARGDVLYVAATGHVELGQADNEVTATVVGIALQSVLAGMAGTYQTTGPVSNPAWSLTPGTVYYLSPSVPGGMTDEFPNTVGDHVVILGAALSATELNLNIHWALVVGS